MQLQSVCATHKNHPALSAQFVAVFVQETAEKEAESISCCRGAARQANMHQGGAVFCLQAAQK